MELSGVTSGFSSRNSKEDLWMKRVAAKFLPHLFCADHKQYRVGACFVLKEEFEMFPRCPQES